MMPVMSPELHVAAAGRRPGLWLRPWRAEDMPALVAEMGREYPIGGLHPGPDQYPERHAGRRWTGPTDDQDAVDWLASQDRGWAQGGWLTFAVLAEAADGYYLAGHVALKNRDDEGRLGQRETGEIGYWTAVEARGQGVAPAAVRAVTAWAFETFGPASLRQNHARARHRQPRLLPGRGQGRIPAQGVQPGPAAPLVRGRAHPPAGHRRDGVIVGPR